MYDAGMFRKSSLTCVILTTAALLAAAPVNATSEVPQNTPMSILSERQQDEYLNTDGYSGYGAYFDQSGFSAVSNVRSSPLPPIANGEQDQSVWDWQLCTSTTDTDCSIASSNVVRTDSALGVCMNAEEIGCIEEINAKIGNGDSETLQLVAHAGAETVFAENVNLSIPRGSSPTVWESAGGQRFLATALVSRTFSGGSDPLLNSRTEFILQIERISTTQILRPARAFIMDSPYYQGKHLFSINQLEYTPLMFDNPTEFTVKVRLPDVVNGWFQARFANGDIASSQLSADRTLYEISGAVASVVVAGGLASAIKLPADFFQKVHGGISLFPGALLGPIPPGQGNWSLDVYKAWAPYFNDRALTTMYQWNVASTGIQGGHECLRSTKGVLGLVATNAAAYSGEPPVWDDATSSLSYKVASPHYDEDGEVITGSYTLSVLPSVAQCLYGIIALPIVAEVTVQYDGVSTYETTRTITENQGWLNFSVTGFHYSSPTIKVKLGKKLATTQYSASNYIEGNRVSASKIAAYAQLPIATKGKLSLKVSASSKKFCKVVRSHVIGLKSGKRCKVTVVMAPPRGKPQSRTVSVLIRKQPTAKARHSSFSRP